MANNAKSTGTGLSLSTGIFLVFLILKLADIGTVATWSWWWVTSPLWIPLGILLGILAICGIGLGIIKGIDAAKGN